MNSRYGGAVREWYLYKTVVKGYSKKKMIVAAARRLAEVMYSILRDKSEYEVRPWTGKRESTSAATKLCV
jgi:transposase